MMNQRCRVIIIGGGLAGLSAAMQLADRGILVELFSLTKVKRSHSVCAQGGINAALNLKGENDSPYIHAYDTIKGGVFFSRSASCIGNVFNRSTHYSYAG